MSAPLSQQEKEWLRKWLHKADNDLAAAELLAVEPMQYETTAFHCQQAVEKYLKARGFAALLNLSRSHNLVRLLHELGAVETFTQAELDWATKLNPFAVEIRYPSDDDADETPIADLLAAARHFRTRLRPAIEAALR